MKLLHTFLRYGKHAYWTICYLHMNLAYDYISNAYYVNDSNAQYVHKMGKTEFQIAIVWSLWNAFLLMLDDKQISARSTFTWNIFHLDVERNVMRKSKIDHFIYARSFVCFIHNFPLFEWINCSNVSTENKFNEQWQKPIAKIPSN